MKKSEKLIRNTGVILCELFAAISVIIAAANNDQKENILLALATIFLILAPMLVERIMNRKFTLPVYLICLLYAIGPMLGDCYKFYYIMPGWDKMQHMLGGVIFAFLGVSIFEKAVGKDSKKIIITAVFALCFSMAVSVLWEFYEYGADTFFGMDMQKDTVIDHINSYLLDEGVGIAGSIDNIDAVIVNGERLPVNGYIDIGLNDTMQDMLIETLGAAVVAIGSVLTKGKLTIFKAKEPGILLQNAAQGTSVSQSVV